jgi:hypothetical protein
MKLTRDYLINTLGTSTVAVITFVFAAAIRLFFRDDHAGRTLFIMGSFAVSYYAYHNLSTQWKRVSRGILIGLAIFMFLILLSETMKAATSNTEFDFMCFYMQGQLGVHHLNFYDPHSFKILLQNNNLNYTFSQDFKSQIIDVGLLSPPITMLFFAPLSSIDYHTSRLILTILIFIFIFGNAVLANIIFVKNDRSFYSFLFILLIIMFLPGTSETIGYNQTNFFLLFFLLLALYKINKPISGFYLAISLIIKPISGLLVLFFISAKKWKPVIYFAATLIALFSITASLWGFQNISGFFQSPPTQRLPQQIYLQNINQSLIAVLNRNLQRYSLSKIFINSIYYFCALIMIVLSYIASKGLNKLNLYLSFFVFVLCMLMIYPSSLWHYMVYLTPLLIYFLLQKQNKKYFWIIILPAISFLGTEVFFTYLILWIALLCLGFFFSNDEKIFQKFNAIPETNPGKYDSLLY